MELKSYWLRTRGGSQQAVAKYVDASGRERRTYKSFGPVSEAQAKRLMLEWVLSLMDSEPPAPRVEPPAVPVAPVGQSGPQASVDVVSYCTSLVSSRLALQQIERSTADDYLKSIRSWSPWLGGVPMGEVSREMVEGAMASMLSQGRSPSTVSKRLVALRMALTDALERGVVVRDPTRGIKRPRKGVEPKNFLPASERSRLLGAVSSSPSRLSIAIRLALLCGLRRGEICGLQVWDVEPSRLWVRRAIGEANHEEYVKATKADRMRDVPLPASLSSSLLSVASSHGPRDFLLGDGPSFWSPAKLTRQWSALADGLGLVGVLGRRPTFHDLRHTYATVAISAGVDVKTVSSVLGHADASMTLNVYAVADPVAKAASASAVVAAM